jgi:KUP system potassium uptake protein
MSTASVTHNKSISSLTLAALGVVYGDIGTSPLYAFREAFIGEHGLPVTFAYIAPTLSTMFWALMLVISYKYVWIVLRFNNQGEGGVLALTALVNRVQQGTPRWAGLAALLGIFAAALFYGDAIITPAISVLSAVEGITVVAPSFSHYVLIITATVLVTLFSVQRHGTARMG